MALAYKLTAVDNGGQPNFSPGDLTLGGDLRVSVDYVDDGNPNVALYQTTFVVSHRETPAEIDQRIKAKAKTVRDARQRITDLSAFIGTVRTLD